MSYFKLDLKENGQDVRNTLNFLILSVEDALKARDEIWFTGVDGNGKPIQKKIKLQSLNDTNRLYASDPETKARIEAFIDRIWVEDNPIDKGKFKKYLLMHDDFVDAFFTRYIAACQNDLFPGLVVG